MIDIIKLVQDIRENGRTNYSIQLTLQTEDHYRSMIFSLPSHSDASRRLKVTLIT